LNVPHFSALFALFYDASIGLGIVQPWARSTSHHMATWHCLWLCNDCNNSWLAKKSDRRSDNSSFGIQTVAACKLCTQ
jgi:hypothetical protein